jgi:tryptophan halogenase
VSTPDGDIRIRNVVIVGGGTAGWMSAAALCKALANQPVSIRVVESDEIPTVGVGEATIPQIRVFNQLLGLDEAEFMSRTAATIKLGIEFVDWWKLGHRYIHPFGVFGEDLGHIPFHHYWLKLFQRGEAQDIGAYSLPYSAAQAGKFERRPDLTWAIQFDAGLYAKYLREYSEKRGVRRTEGKVVTTKLRGEDGFIESVQLESGEVIAGELFIDCSGFRGLLIEQALQTGYEDWSRFLPCNRALATMSESAPRISPFTRSTAHKAGWQWRIPLQHRIGTGHVYCSEYTSDDEAVATLLGNLDGACLMEPKPLRFVTGRRRKLWNRNCVAVGLSSGFLEPLESTSIHLIQASIARLLRTFPNKRFEQADIDIYNRHCHTDYERIRDFIILHYKATARDDTPFWRYCGAMPIPDMLQEKIRVYEASGRIHREDEELWMTPNWLAVMHGQGIRARDYDPLVDNVPIDAVRSRLENLRVRIAKTVAEMKTHEEFLSSYCPYTGGAK